MTALEYIEQPQIGSTMKPKLVTTAAPQSAIQLAQSWGGQGVLTRLLDYQVNDATLDTREILPSMVKILIA